MTHMKPKMLIVATFRGKCIAFKEDWTVETGTDRYYDRYIDIWDTYEILSLIKCLKKSSDKKSKLLQLWHLNLIIMITTALFLFSYVVEMGWSISKEPETIFLKEKRKKKTYQNKTVMLSQWQMSCHTNMPASKKINK